MKNYLITVIIVAICIGSYNIIAPISHGIEKYSKMIGMLVLLCVIISPFKDIMRVFNEEGLQSVKDSITQSDENSNEYDIIFKDYLNSFSLEEVKREIENILLQKYGIPEGDCEIKIFTEKENESIRISDMQILLSGNSIFKNPYTIEEYFENLLNCSCEVLIK